MALQGKHTKIERWIHAAPCVVRVVVDAIVPDADPSEACLEPQTIQFLDDLQRNADCGFVGELVKVGDVYIRRTT
jgi:hypothetical protein